MAELYETLQQLALVGSLSGHPYSDVNLPVFWSCLGRRRLSTVYLPIHIVLYDQCGLQTFFDYPANIV